MKKVFGFIVDVLTFLIFLVLVLIIFSRVKMMVSGKEYFDVFGYSIFNVVTGSMEPIISQNDVIIVKECDNYELNDIVTFKSDNAYVTHKIISKSGNTVITKGEANNARDVPIKQDEIIGKVVHVIKQGGIWRNIFTSPVIIIMVFVTLMLFDFAFSYKGNNKEENTKENNKVSISKNIKDFKDKNVKKLKELKDKKVSEIKSKKEKIDSIKKEKEEKKIELNKQRDKELKEKNKEVKPKLSDKEIVDLYKKSDMAKKVDNNKKDDELGYTVRLDLSELQKRINKKMNEDKDE